MSDDIYLDPTEWPRIYQQRTSPPPSDPARIVDWIHFQHIPASREDTIASAIDRLQIRHRGTSSRSLAISAPTGAGKTSAVTSVVLRDAMTGDRSWFERDPETARTYIPWVYVNPMTSGSSVSVLRQVAEFCAMAPGKNEDDLHRRLSRTLPEHGVKAIIVDEAHRLRRSSARSTRLTDGLRGLMHLRTPIVWVGIDLESSGLLRDFGSPTDSVRQVKERTDLLGLSIANGPAGATEFRRLVREFGRRLSQIDGFRLDGLTEPGMLQRLAMASEARVGTAFETLKNAAVDAVVADRVLSASRLLANMPGGEAVA